MPAYAPALKARSKIAAITAPPKIAKSPTGTKDHSRIDAAMNGRNPADLTDADCKDIAAATGLSYNRVVNSIAMAIVQAETDPETFAAISKLPTAEFAAALAAA